MVEGIIALKYGVYKPYIIHKTYLDQLENMHKCLIGTRGIEGVKADSELCEFPFVYEFYMNKVS